MDYTKIISAVITLVVLLITTFVIPWLKNRVSAQQLSTWEFWINIAVTAAEQIFTSEQATKKKEYVIAYLKDKGIKFDESTVNNMIEAAVLKLHNELYGSTKSSTATTDTSTVTTLPTEYTTSTGTDTGVTTVTTSSTTAE